MTTKRIPIANEDQAAVVADLKRVGRAWARVNATRDKTHAELQEKIRAAGAAGLRPEYIIRATGAARETVYRVLRAQPKPDAAAEPAADE